MNKSLNITAALLIVNTVLPFSAAGAGFVDNMRQLANLPYYASDGTNCMRTIGMAAKGTPLEGQINIDYAYKIAAENGLIRNSESYIPKPGDVAIVENGNHAVMVTEYGGTIQNGKSHNGVWEDSQSPERMFGKVNYYIALNEINHLSNEEIKARNRLLFTLTTDKLNNDMNMLKNNKNHNKTQKTAMVFYKSI